MLLPILLLPNFFTKYRFFCFLLILFIVSIVFIVKVVIALRLIWYSDLFTHLFRDFIKVYKTTTKNTNLKIITKWTEQAI